MPKASIYLVNRLQERAIKNCTLKNMPTYIEHQSRYLSGLKLTKFGGETDTRRSNFYKAEKVLPRGNEFSSVEEMQNYTNKVLRSSYFTKRFGEVEVEITSGAGCRKALAFKSRGKISMPRWARCEHILLHEIVHMITPKPHASHGRLFAAIFRDIVPHFHSGDTDELKALLTQSYRDNNVKWHPFRTLQV